MLSISQFQYSAHKILIPMSDITYSSLCGSYQHVILYSIYVRDVKHNSQASSHCHECKMLTLVYISLIVQQTTFKYRQYDNKPSRLIWFDFLTYLHNLEVGIILPS